MKSRSVLMIADVEGWAYDFIAKSISGKFRKYEASTVYFRDLIIDAFLSSSFSFSGSGTIPVIGITS